MGIHNLSPFLKKKCPIIFRDIHISKYRFKKIAVDLSLFLCKYKTVCGDRWIQAFINLVCCLRKYEVHPIFIYDSGAPPEKELERQERREHKRKLEEKWFNLNQCLELYHKTGEIDQSLRDLYEKYKSKEPTRFLNVKKQTIDMSVVENSIEKIKGQIINISPEDYELTKRLFDILNVPYLQAPLEAETCCADLCKRGLVDGALSEDSDLLAYGCPIFLNKLDTSNGMCVEITYTELLQELDVTTDTFLDFCIMCGCDYNKNIPNIGPVKSFMLLKKFNSIENIVQNNPTIDITTLNHIRSRELFKDYEMIENLVVYCGTPDFVLLEQFITRNNIRLDINSLKYVFSPSIVFVEE